MIEKRWAGPCIVAGSGPSLTPEVAAKCRGYPAIAVNDAYRLLTFADVLYAGDGEWWKVHKGCPDFYGEKWTCLSYPRELKRALAYHYHLQLAPGHKGEGFSLEPSHIHWGRSSGAQAINLAILWGARPIILVGFDMNGDHFFGKHPPPLKRTRDYQGFIEWLRQAARLLPPDIVILNATPGSSMGCFPKVNLEEALNESRAA